MTVLGALIDASQPEAPASLKADVIVVGSGAGGGIAAEILSQAGLDVLIVEQGGFYQAADFTLRERDAYADLYADMAGRKTADKGITILQGQCVGGGTTVNWTSSFRTPLPTLSYWQQAHQVSGLSAEAMAPWFERIETRLNIAPWLDIPPNPNNAALARGAAALDIPTAPIPRNVRDCQNLGLCGLGCPVNAKQSTLVTAIPAARKAGARLLVRARTERLLWSGSAVTGAEVRAMAADGSGPTTRRLTLRARHVVLAAGAIGSPAILLRSEAPDPHGRLGRRTCLHPTVGVTAEMPDPVEAYAGAPQSIYSDHFLWRDGVTGRVGYKLEAAPIFPALAAAVSRLHGWSLASRMAAFPKLTATIALMRDGFHPESNGGRVRLTGAGEAVLDYPVSTYLQDGIRRAYRTMLRIAFAAGARRASPLHMDAPADGYATVDEAMAAVRDLRLERYRTGIFSAHVMGGCAMGEEPRFAVVNSEGRHHQLENLWVLDGSVFPTSIGANPQVSIMALAARNATRMAEVAKN